MMAVLLGAGAMVVFTVIDTTPLNNELSDTFDVADASADQYCGLEHGATESSITVTQYNGTGWTEIGDTHITYYTDNETVKVASAGLDNGGGSGNTTTSLNITYNSEHKDTFTSIGDTSGTVFDLLTVLLIVLVAAAIIGVIYYAFGGFGGSGGATGGIGRSGGIMPRM